MCGDSRFTLLVILGRGWNSDLCSCRLSQLESQRVVGLDDFRSFSSSCGARASFSEGLAFPFPQCERAPPWEKARLVLHNSMEGSGNEFGKDSGSAPRSHGRGRGMSLEPSSQLIAHSSFLFEIRLLVSFTFTPTRERLKRALNPGLESFLGARFACQRC